MGARGTEERSMTGGTFPPWTEATFRREGAGSATPGREPSPRGRSHRPFLPAEMVQSRFCR